MSNQVKAAKSRRFTSEGDNQASIHPPPIQEISPLESHIMSVYNSSSDIHSFKFQLACQSFQSFVEKQYHMKLATAIGADEFFGDLFNKINVRNLRVKYSGGPNFHYFLFLNLLLDLEIGNQAMKANRFLNVISVISPDDSAQTFKYFEEILIWLDNPLKTSFRIKLQPLRDLIINWYNKTSNESEEKSKNKISSLRLMIIFLKNFPSFISGDFENYKVILMRAISDDDINVKQLAAKAYIISASLCTRSKFRHLASPIIEFLRNELNDRKFSVSAKTIDAISDLVTRSPEITKSLQFSEIPYGNSTDVTAVTMKIIPLAYHCSPHIFTETNINMILNLYCNSISKKDLGSSKKSSKSPSKTSKQDEIKYETLKSLSEFVFAIGIEFHNEIYNKERLKLITQINNNIHHVSQLVAIMSLMNPKGDALPQAISNYLFTEKFPKEPFLLNGILNFCKKWPDDSELIQEKLISKLLNEFNNSANVLTDPKANNEDKYNAAKNIESNFIWMRKASFYKFNRKLLIHFSRYLFSPYYIIRKSVALFLVLHQQTDPIISAIIISFVATEQITELRIHVFKKLNTASEDMAPLLSQMLHDREVEICSKSLKLLCNIPSAISLISSFVIELMQQIGKSDALNRRILGMLLIIKDYHQQILQPFASHLCETILNFEAQSHHSLLFLSFLVSTNPTMDVDISLLGRVLRNALCSDSNTRRISAALDLLFDALKYLDMESEYSFLFTRLLALSGEVEEAEVTSKIQKSISKIGVLQKAHVSSLVCASKLQEKPNRRLEFTESLENSARSIPISISLEVMSDQSLVNERSTAFNCFLNFLKDFKQCTEKSKKIILDRLEKVLTIDTSLLMMQNFNAFINCFGNDVAPLIPHVVRQIIEQWDHLDISAILPTVKYITLNILDLFSPYILQFTELFLLRLPSLKPKDAISVFDVFTRFNNYLKTVDYLIIPAMLIWLESHLNECNVSSTLYNINLSPYNSSNPANIISKFINDGLNHLKTIILYTKCNKYASEILRTMFVIIQANKDLKEPAFEIIFTITVHLMKDIMPFLSQIFFYTDLMGNNENDEYRTYMMVLECIRIGKDIPQKIKDKYELTEITKTEEELCRKYTTFPIKATTLETKLPEDTWEAVDWFFWYDELIPQVLNNSGSSMVSLLQPLFERNFTIRSALFPISFAVHFRKGDPNYQLVRSIIFKVFSNSKKAPVQIVRRFLEVIETLEQSGVLEEFFPLKGSPTDGFCFENIAQRAKEVGEYAQALRYYEYLFKEYISTKKSENVNSFLDDPVFFEYASSLVFLNKNIKLPLAVNSIIEMSNDFEVNLFKESLAEDLGEFDKALKSYDKKIKKFDGMRKKDPNFIGESPDKIRGYTIGKMRCLEALSRFDKLDEMIGDNINEIAEDFLPFAASVSWKIGNIDKFKKVAMRLNDQNYYFKAILALINQDYSRFQKTKDRESILHLMQKEIEKEVFPLISTDYDRAYDDLCKATIFNFMEEIVDIRFLKSTSDTLPFQRSDEITILDQQIKKNWLRRFKEMSESQIAMFDTMRVLSLYLSDEELEPFRIQFLLKSTKFVDTELTKRVISQVSKDNSEVRFAVAKMFRADPSKRKANPDEEYKMLSQLLVNEPKHSKLRAKIFRVAASWYIEDGIFEGARRALKQLIKINPNDSTVWFTWSSLNFTLAEKERGNQRNINSTNKNNSNNNKNNEMNSDNKDDHFIMFNHKENKNDTKVDEKKPSFMEDSFRAILEGLKLNPEQPLRFTLRAVSILLKFGTNEIYSMFREYSNAIPSSIWIALLPQIISRMGAEDQDLRSAIVSLLVIIGESHPHAVLYSLLASYKSSVGTKNQDATQILDHLKLQYPNIISQILVFSDGLMKIASTNWEQWYNALNTACIALQGIDENASKTYELVLPLYKMLSSTPPKTLYEISFVSQFGKMLSDALPFLESAIRTGDKLHLMSSWQKLIPVLQGTRTVISTMSSIAIDDASPELAKMKDFELAVPGTDYTSKQPILIDKICDSFTVFNSKQHPRKMWIRGNNGKMYFFLLKANEDTRLDERVMQLFDYISQAISHTTNVPFGNKMTISCYKVVPLSGKVGMIGWLNNCQTIFDLLRSYRNRFNIDVNEELNVWKETMANQNPQGEKIDDMMMLNAFEEAIKSPNKNGVITGNELQKLLIMSSSDSNDWLDRRINFTTSLAVTSMAGYLIGLGDRHLKNIMMNNRTSKLVHIDFGDSFEKTMVRKNLPEKVPFRLTRMFLNALDVAGPEGTMKRCCELAWESIRKSSEQILVLLETFIYDPLEIKTDNDETIDPHIIIDRIHDKLKGTDLNTLRPLNAESQVRKLIDNATQSKNLCQMYSGWAPWY